MLNEFKDQLLANKMIAKAYRLGVVTDLQEAIEVLDKFLKATEVWDHFNIMLARNALHNAQVEMEE